MRAAALLFLKDVRLLRRAPALLLVLVAFPLLVALLVALALQSDERRPDVGLVVLDTSGRSVEVGERRLSIDDYVERLSNDVNVRELDPEAAQAALDDGRVTAVLTIPEGFIADLQSGVRPPALELAASRRSPIQADAIERRLEAAVYRLNQSLATGYVEGVLRLVDLVIDGGEIGIFGRSGDALGLRRSRNLVLSVQAQLREAGQGAAARRLAPLLNFIDETEANLDLARPAANAIRAPIELQVSETAEGREPLSAFGFAGALLVSLGLAGVLLAAAAMASEREDHALARLRRGLIAAPSLVAEKMVFTAGACLIVGLLLLGGVALFTSLAVGRWVLWLVALLLSGLAFGALGVLAGALARETRTALLVALMLALPLLALGLLPDEEVAHAISQAVPFGPAFDAFQTLLVEPAISAGDLTLTLGHLALLAAAFGGLATWAVSRRAAD
ncbi:MAG TPA: ABC transporter permease [Miltoncostaeaceae bacterium]|nr:ABC transporter permease [Miltoncostaeaceae bacterium]